MSRSSKRAPLTEAERDARRPRARRAGRPRGAHHPRMAVLDQVRASNGSARYSPIVQSGFCRRLRSSWFPFDDVSSTWRCGV